MQTVVSPNGAGALQPDRIQAGKPRQTSLQEACSEFESLFLNFMLKGMRDTVPQSGFISGGKAEALYTSLLDSHLAREIAHKRSIGLTAYLQGHLEKEDPAVVKPD